MLLSGWGLVRGKRARETPGKRVLIVKHALVLGIAVIGVLVPAFALGSGGNGPDHTALAVLVPPAAPVRVADPTAVMRATAIPTDTATPATEVPTEAALALVEEAAPVVEVLPTMVVREGDTMGALADWFGVTTWDIAAANGMVVDDFLQIDTELAIPVSADAFVLPPDPMAYVAVAEPEISYEEVPVVAAVPAPVITPAPAPLPTGDIAAIICSFPWPCEQMLRIAACESGMNPNAVNPYGYYGLFQIAAIFDGWNDPYTNARVAYEQKYLPALARGGDGLSPWPYCRYR